MSRPFRDLTDMEFGKWLVVGFSHSRTLNGKLLRYWQCRCTCGAAHAINGFELMAGRSTQCRKCHSTTHGFKYTPEYRAWSAMKSRCFNPRVKAWPNYGGRGITVCERWMKFENFIVDMGRRPAKLDLDRIDNNGDYEPENCRWTTRSENIKNTRPRERNELGQFA